MPVMHTSLRQCVTVTTYKCCSSILTEYQNICQNILPMNKIMSLLSLLLSFFVIVNNFMLFAYGLPASNIERCAGNVCIPSSYNQWEKPLVSEGGVIEIGVDIEILQIIEIDDLDFSITLVMYLNLYWNEPRILNNQTDGIFRPVDLSLLKDLWVPDIYIYNLKSISKQSIFTDFAGTYVLFIK